MKNLLRAGMGLVLVGLVVSSAVVSTGCSKAEDTPVQKENTQKGQADAFRARTGGGAAAPTR